MLLKKKDFFICITLGILIGLILKTPYLSYMLVGILIGIFFAVYNEKDHINLYYFKNYPFRGLVWISSLIVIIIKLSLMIIPEFISFSLFSSNFLRFGSF